MTPAPEKTRTLLIAAAGLALGALVVFVLPAEWVFVGRDHAQQTSGTTTVQYACPMFCVVMDHAPEDGKCPVCGMDMTEVSGESSLDRAEQRMIGLQVSTAARLPLVRSLRLVGEVDYDESRLARITTRMGGWLETVWVDATWTEVAEGEPLASIYSPELYAAEEEVVVSVRAVRTAEEAGRSADSARTLLAAAKRRLELLGVADEEVAELVQRGAARDAVVLRSPLSGVIVERSAIEGASVKTGARLYTVADLSRVWVQAQVFETDLATIRVGQTVRLDVDGASESVAGVIAFVDPAIDRTARTARVRIELENARRPDGTRPLRIGQRVDAWVEAPLDAAGAVAAQVPDTDRDRPIAVPRSAVLRTGERNLIYVLFTETDTAAGRTRDYELDPTALPDRVWYEPVEVRIGPLARLPGAGAVEEHYPVLGVVPPRPVRDRTTGEMQQSLTLRRLTAGTAVVTRGNLLLDSQAQLAGRPSLLFPEGNRGGSADPHAGH